MNVKYIERCLIKVNKLMPFFMIHGLCLHRDKRLNFICFMQMKICLGNIFVDPKFTACYYVYSDVSLLTLSGPVQPTCGGGGSGGGGSGGGGGGGQGGGGR